MKSIIILFLFLAIYAVIFIVTGLWKRTPIGEKLIKKKKKSPIRDKLLRSPGESLRSKEREAVMDFALNVGISPLPVFMTYAILISERNLGFAVQLILGCMGIVSFVIFLLKARQSFRDLQILWLGLDGELAATQELNNLMTYGYHVYHDFPAENFNIDHIVIGPAGVFAVETKAKTKPNKKGLESAKVSFDGEVLRFPDGQNSEFIGQAKMQAKWLADFLGKSVGKAVPVTSVLALPGWMVDRLTNNESLLVINPKEAVKLIPKRADVLDMQTIQQVKYQVEQRCRTVEPYEPVM